MGVFQFLCGAALLCWPPKVLTPEYLAVEYVHFQYGRFLETPTVQPDFRLALNAKLRVLGPLYWDNRVWFLQGNYKVQWVAYRFEVGLDLWQKHLQLFYQHDSEHCQDCYHPVLWPVYDGWGVRLIFLME